MEGLEGGETSFQCSHKLAWNYNKYLCKDPCKGSGDTLVTVRPGRRAESGRITLVDSANGVFTVTFSQLQLSDSRTYWCGVDRPGFDTFTAVHLTVKKGTCMILSLLNNSSLHCLCIHLYTFPITIISISGGM